MVSGYNTKIIVYVVEQNIIIIKCKPIDFLLPTLPLPWANYKDIDMLHTQATHRDRL